ncbi:hypothetical protein SAMN05444166_1422 [Singulisphaera sp. GP187]|nr:hypothetical protein SAMN05444166_1422 [Singulisphaera sp. GP187]
MRADDDSEAYQIMQFADDGCPNFPDDDALPRELEAEVCGRHEIDGLGHLDGIPQVDLVGEVGPHEDNGGRSGMLALRGGQRIE